ncbi:hypothetical protein HDU79_011936 [Rhizoclosmatium sp. JEL0117]|nr:hypothetical protein HDU79_011936 [Rhizoclosmatium sp. JEL0117]
MQVSHIFLAVAVVAGSALAQSQACMNDLTPFLNIVTSCKIDFGAISANPNAPLTSDQNKCLCTDSSKAVINKLLVDCASPTDKNTGKDLSV